MNEERYHALLANQLAMNAETWRILQSRGVTEQTELRLDFAYWAANQVSAEALKDFLEAETDCAVTRGLDGDAPVERWGVQGSTNLTTISKSILDQWVEWMVAAGMDHDCEFDGWGTQV
jgi:hypothetical protein